MRPHAIACTIVCLAIEIACAGTYPTNEVYENVLEMMPLYHVELRTEALAAIRKKYNVSDDDFSMLLLKVAEEFKTGEHADIRCFAFGSLFDFGTTNALAYVKNEALHGPDFSGGLDCYALITGFDQRCFELADIVFAEKKTDTSLRKVSFYNFLCAASISGDEYYGRKITRENQARIIEYFRKSARVADASCSRLADEILLECDPSYKGSEARKRNIRHMIECLPTNSVAYAYFKAEQRKIDEDEMAGSVATEDNQLDENKIHLSNSVTVIFACSLFLIFVVIYLILRKRT